MRRYCLSVLVLIAMSAGAAAEAADFKLMSHRAIYELSLGKSRQAGEVAGIRGRMVMEWSNACDGRTHNQRMHMEVQRADGGVTATEFTISSWEAFDGNLLRYAIRNHVNEQLVEEYRGRAERNGADGAGEAIFERPEGMSVQLPAGTLFPDAHSDKLVAAALEGRSFLSARVFDGSGEEGLNTVTAFIGQAREEPKIAERFPPLAGKQAWPVRMAFYDIDAGDERPSYEVGLNMYANGVASGFELDYESFTVLGALSRLDVLAEPSC
ncbi:hypothetical protein OCH7691_01836 [Oceanibacterium hippocampi]|uniref:ATP-binding protein n=2 Tax=Oceanibacterium hippocampi TaxID=745714 RepID=A0A1Y5SM07_9PROT|nr:hypothetical protein OCH7691_01836 [Oceanibacterium hippocampi]